MTKTQFPGHSEVLTRDNYAQFAQNAINKYEKENLIIDALLWNEIIKNYDADLKRKDDALFAALSVLQMSNVPDGTTHTSKQAFDLVLAALLSPPHAQP